MNFEFKEKYKMSDLIEIIDILRSPNGCPWDKEQTHKSIRSNFIEEAYEVIEAIDTDNIDLLKEELGDVLLQVVFHSKMEEELGNFDFDDVADGICKKLIIRHPHVFSNLKVNSSDEVLNNWDKIKMKTKSQNKQSEAMKSISKALPVLMRSKKVQQKASKIGLDFKNENEAMDKVLEEYNELLKVVNDKSFDNCFEKIGNLLFSIVGVSRILEIDPEYALWDSCNKFVERFERAEKTIENKGLDISSLPEQELDLIWKQYKE